MKLLLLAAACLATCAAALTFTACGGDDDDAGSGDSPTAVRTTIEGFAATPGTSSGDATVAPGATQPSGSGATPRATAGNGETGGSKTYSSPPPMTIDEDKTYIATIKTEVGDIKVELFADKAPIHVNNFVFLSREGFYDGVTFHRVIPGFVAQAGDPTGTGRGGPGYTIQDEVNDTKFEDGTLGMAKTAAPNSAGSQWFIDYAPQPNLDGSYTAFGKVIEGRDILDEIAPRDPATATTPGTKIITIEIEEQ